MILQGIINKTKNMKEEGQYKMNIQDKSNIARHLFAFSEFPIAATPLFPILEPKSNISKIDLRKLCK